MINDKYFMREALQQAIIAFEKDEVPVGAVIVWNSGEACSDSGAYGGGQIIARAYNMTEQLKDATAHAEMLAFTASTNAIGGKYLDECTIYVTLEPCIMCAGASFWTQIGRIVYGASDPKRGFLQASSNILHPKTTITGGVLADECSALLKQFFEKKR
ncbi:MAG: nucleoside deaminase [Bacteroidales bacterium]|jgi:tRNA(adenine34) deaminase|nr:nucleoside deaminase [Bacteroidales bacterium]